MFITKSMSRPDSSAQRSARQSAWIGVITFVVDPGRAPVGAVPRARLRPRRPFVVRRIAVDLPA